MRTSYTRYTIVLGLILATGLGAAGARLQRAEPVIPPVSQLTSGTGWQVTDTYAPAGLPYRKWQLRDPAGHQALLYVGASARSVPAMAWNGELGYEGAGYAVSHDGERRIALSDGSSAAVSLAHVQHLSDAQVLLYAVASPRGVLTPRLQSLAETTWDAVGGDAGPYYVVRVAVPAGTSDRSATQLASTFLGAVLPKLVADAQNP